jgi:hypothetical protein
MRVPLNSLNIELIATCFVALGLALYAWQRERTSVKPPPSSRAKIFRYAVVLSIESPAVCGSQGPLVVASGGLSGIVWFTCFAALMIRYM